VKGLFLWSQTVKFKAGSYDSKKRSEGLVLVKLRAYFRTIE